MHRPGAVREELDGRAVALQPQRTDFVDLLAIQAEAFTTRRQHPQAPGLFDQFRHDRRTVDHVLDVVDDQQRPPVCDGLGDRRDRSRATGHRDADGVGHDVRDGPRIVGPGEVGEPHRVRAQRPAAPPDVGSQPRLADPARTEQRDEAVTTEQVEHGIGVGLPADQRARRPRQRHGMPERPQGWESRGQPLPLELV